ncbi:ankycorbin [Microplitis demolitor]|uniref:ankycorbin n=1 Tax=Microplitis demolitor TaxID=69319 RepID=UPI0004CD0108|nr:ankycorbin [Microplitis demolitor]
MDTKTPPIAFKHQEKKPQAFKADKSATKTGDVSLPPLTPLPNGSSHNRTKILGTQWNKRVPCVTKSQERTKKRPYRVLHIGATPLMHACQQGDRSRVLRLLKDQEETIGYRDRTLRNALHYCMDAATGGAVASAAPELVNAVDAEGHTPLHLAVIAGDTQLVAVLLANGADVNAKDLEGHSVLHWATVCGEAECVRLVLAAGARPTTPDLRGGSPLHYAAQCCGAAVTAELSVPKKIGLKVLQTLLEFGADVNAKDEDGRQPILWAASAGSVEAVLALARTGGSAAAGATDKDGLTALHCAASRGHAKCVEALVNLCGAQPDHVDDNGCSALHYAATLGHADATALLLRLGADPNRQDRKGRTPALCAAAKGQLETLKILAQHGGSLHARTVRGTGVAHEAVLSGRIELIEWLARKKPATLDVATHDGRTPLHVAALHGYLDACKVLLDHGARINSIFRTSKSGSMTPLDAALYRGHRDCAKLIQMHGGTTAQNLRSHRTAPNRVFAAKLKVKRRGSSSGSESDSGRRNHRVPDVYIEERWVERRTRRRSTPRKHEDRRGSRSFSEEEVRLSKSSRRDRRRRARSESARYDDSEPEKRERKKSCHKKHSKHEYGESSSELDDYSSDDIGEGEAEKNNKRNVSNDEDRSLSDDSLEVVVVRRSLEKKSEKVQYSGRNSKTPREMSRETKMTETKRKSSRRKAKTVSSSGKEENGAGSERKMKSRESASEGSAGKKEGVREGKSKPERRPRKDTDSTSQEAVERVTVTALVHKDQASADTPRSTHLIHGSESKHEDFKMMDDELSKNKIDDILEKADEMQNALMAKAADLKKDVDEIRRQMSDKKSAGDDGGKGKHKKASASKGRKENKNESEVTAKNSQSELSTLQSQHEDKDGGESTTIKDMENQKVESTQDEPKSNVEKIEVTSESKVSDADEESASEESRSTSRDGSSSATSKRSEEPKSQAGESGKESLVQVEKSDEEKNEVESTKTLPVEEKQADKKQDDKKEVVVNDEKKIEVDEKIEVEANDKEEIEVTDKKEGEVDDKKGDKVDEKVEHQSPEKLESTIEKSEQETAVLEVPQSAQKSADKQEAEVSTSENIRHIDSSSSSAKSTRKLSHSRPSTGKSRRTSSKSSSKKSLFESSEERSPDRSAIVAVIESPEWDEEDEEVAKEIRDVVGDAEPDTDPEDDDSLGVLRVLPSTSEEESPRRLKKLLRESKRDKLPRVERKTIGSPRGLHAQSKQRRDSGGRDSGIEPSPRVSKIPKRTLKCYPNTEKQQALNIDTITRDVQISLRRYHLERKIFFQLMELKRLQIRHGRANEQVLVKRQVEMFHKAGMSGPALGVAKYDQPYTFKDFETFLYEQLRRLQRRPPSSDRCTDPKQCTKKTHRCHHATSAYTSVPVFTYLGGGSQERDEGSLFPRIESRGKGQMTVEVTRGEEKQIIALPAEKLDRTKRYFVTFTVRGDNDESDIKTPRNAQRATKSV